MKTILYIHGFNSAGNSNKSLTLKSLYPNVKVLSPSFDYKNFESVKKQLASLFVTQKIDAVIGTSLGGFLALYSSAQYKKPAVVINPTTQPSNTLLKMLGKNKNFVTGKVYVLTEQDLEQYKKFEDEIFNQIKLDNELVTFILSTDDELLGDHTYLEQRYSECKRFHYFSGQGHRFTSLKIIKKYIDEALGM